VQPAHNDLRLLPKPKLMVCDYLRRLHLKDLGQQLFPPPLSPDGSKANLLALPFPNFHDE
jgi:hypothetical protein